MNSCTTLQSTSAQIKDRLGSSANSTVTWQQQGWHRASVKTTNMCWSWHANDLELYHLDLPVDVPLLHVAEAPGFDSISGVCVHPDQTVVGDADQLLTLPTLEPADEGNDTLTVRKMSEAKDVWNVLLSSLGKKMGDSKLGQRLPRLDEAHLCFDQTHLGHILVGFKDAGWNLTNTPLPCQQRSRDDDILCRQVLLITIKN